MKSTAFLAIFLICLMISLISSNNLTHNSEEDNQQISEDNESIKTQYESQNSNKNEKQKAIELYEKAIKLLTKGNKREAYSLLQESAKLNHLSAKVMVAKSHLFGDYLPIDFELSFKYLESIPMNESSSAHLYLGFLYSVGLGVKVNPKMSLSHYQLSALLDNSMAKMAIAFRYLYGLNVEKSCEKALDLYESVANDVVDDSQEFSGDHLNGQHLWQSKDFSNINQRDLDRDLVNYFQFMVKSGDIKAAVSLGQLYYSGGYGVQRDRNRALYYFRRAAKSGNANALAFLGKFYLEGSPPNILQNYSKALELFTVSASKGNPIGTTELGLMFKYGKGVEIDFEKAFKLFAQSSRQGWVDGLLQTGIMYMNGLGVARDYRIAVKYLNLALNSKHLLAFYNLAQMHRSGAGIMRSCPTAVSLFKSVAERGVWNHMLTEANDDYENQKIFKSLIKYMFLSEIGYELAQGNTAHILENNDICLKYFEGSDDIHNIALKYWTASGMQGMSYSRIKIGDYYYYGFGTDVDYRMASIYYRRASEFKYSAQALFNLGYLHEKGLGVERNLKTAKLYYEMSAQVDSEAEIPASLAKIKLKAIETIESMFWKYWDILLILLLISIILFILLLKNL